MTVAVPPALRRRYSSASWEPVALGLSGAAVWRLGDPAALYAKVVPAIGRLADELGAEVARAG